MDQQKDYLHHQNPQQVVLLFNLMNLVCRYTLFYNRLSLINITSSFLKPKEFRRVRRFVIFTYLVSLRAQTLSLHRRLRTDCPRVTNINNVNEVINNKD